MDKFKIAAFMSHPIQHFSPLWVELAERSDVELKVFYYSNHGVFCSHDAEFGVAFEWDVDLLKGYSSAYLRRQWPTVNQADCRWYALNKDFSRILKDENWDAVYVAGYAHLNNWIIALICGKYDIPLLYHSDSNWLAERFKPSWKIALKKFVIGRFFSKVAVFLSVGDHNREYLLRYGAAAGRIQTCPIPVDVVRFSSDLKARSASKLKELRRKLGIADGVFVAGFCGKLVERKRPADLARAVRSAALRCNRPIIGLFVGSGPLATTVIEVGGDLCKMAGFVNQAEMPDMLALFDVLVMPSEYDPHPIVVTEAQCLGIPVILSDLCGCHGPNDIFRHGETGILYPCGDIASLSAALTFLCNDETTYSHMALRSTVLAESQSPEVAASGILAAVKLAKQQT